MYIISGRFKRKGLISPKGDHVRPTQSKVRESLFNRIQHEIEEATFLDLFAGSGIMGLEALSRGAQKVTLVEKHPASLKAIKENIALLKVEQKVEVISHDVFSSLAHFAKKERSFDFIFADPPYHQGLGDQTLKEIDSLNLLNPEGTLWIEEATSHPQELILQNLKFVREKRMGSTFLREYSLSTS
jgi:16S rRNA (guanine966-N2)-methyltransferase